MFEHCRVAADNVADFLERYYLRERFTQHCNQQPYIDSNYRLRSRDNFIGLGSRWKITSGDDFVLIDEE